MSASVTRYQPHPWVFFMLLSVLAHAAVFVGWGGKLGLDEALLRDSPLTHVLNIQIVKQKPVEKKQQPLPVTEESNRRYQGYRDCSGEHPGRA